jgi:hypothetical protein
MGLDNRFIKPLVLLEILFLPHIYLLNYLIFRKIIKYIYKNQDMTIREIKENIKEMYPMYQ